MKNALNIVLFIGLGLLLNPNFGYCQEVEQESSEIYTEKYSDDFQEAFFEALKQKAIGNFDKAIDLLLRCKEINPSNDVVDHELAKTYMEEGNFMLARDYAIDALNSRPENLWYLNTLIGILQKLGNSIDEIRFEIPIENKQLLENLALVYYRQGNYESSLKILKGIKNSSFTENLQFKIIDLIEESKNAPPIHDVNKADTTLADPLQSYLSQIEQLMASKDYGTLLQIAADALESYPTRPYFYYAYGLALNNTSQYKMASETLESALAYLLDDTELNNKIYRQLSNAFNALGNSSKANMYLSKIKQGS